MASVSLERWKSERAVELDEIEAAHAAVGGLGRGRRYATQQVSHADCVLLSSQFQGFCRDLHTECVMHLGAVVAALGVREILLRQLMVGRKLDTGNPNLGNIGADFNRLGIPFWDRVRARDRRSGQRERRLSELNEWRNAVAHQDFGPVGGGAILWLTEVRDIWRPALSGLAQTFDRVMGDHLTSLTGMPPW